MNNDGDAKESVSNKSEKKEGRSVEFCKPYKFRVFSGSDSDDLDEGSVGKARETGLVSRRFGNLRRGAIVIDLNAAQLFKLEVGIDVEAGRGILYDGGHFVWIVSFFQCGVDNVTSAFFAGFLLGEVSNMEFTDG